MFAQPIVGAAIAVLLAVGAVYVAATLSPERSFAVSSLSPEELELIAPELEASGLTRLTPSQLNELLEKAAARNAQAAEMAKSEVEAREAQAARNEARRKAEQEARLARMREEYEARLSSEIKVIIDKQIKAEAEAKAGITELRHQNELLTADREYLNRRVTELAEERDWVAGLISSFFSNEPPITDLDFNTVGFEAHLTQKVRERVAEFETLQKQFSRYVAEARRLQTEREKLAAARDALESERANLVSSRDYHKKASKEREVAYRNDHHDRAGYDEVVVERDRLATDKLELQRALVEISDRYRQLASSSSYNPDQSSRIAQLAAENQRLQAAFDDLCQRYKQVYADLEQAQAYIAQAGSHPPPTLTVRRSSRTYYGQY